MSSEDACNPAMIDSDKTDTRHDADSDDSETDIINKG